MTQTHFPIAQTALKALNKWQDGTGPYAVRLLEAKEKSQTEIHLSQEALAGPFSDRAEGENALIKLIKRRGENDGCLKLMARCEAQLVHSEQKPKPDQRWPERPKQTVFWMIEIVYWKIGKKAEPSWEKLRQRQALEVMMREPLAAKKKQKALDFGLFEFIPPDDPAIIIPDE